MSFLIQLITKKINKEKENEINEYNYYMDKAIYAKKINDERKQMTDNNLINKYEYRKYRDRLNNQIISLPKIYLRPIYKSDRQNCHLQNCQKSNEKQ